MPVEYDHVCFVISPIGEDGSDERLHADLVLETLIHPAAGNFGYKVVRADNIHQPGIITEHIFEYLIDSPLVIADLTFQNPNVFYELALRHAARKPVIHLIRKGHRLPFDVAPMHTIRFDYERGEEIRKCKDDISKQIESIQLDPNKFSSTLSVALLTLEIKRSQDLQSEVYQEIFSLLEDIRGSIEDVESEIQDANNGIQDLQDRIPDSTEPSAYKYIQYGLFDEDKIRRDFEAEVVQIRSELISLQLENREPDKLQKILVRLDNLLKFQGNIHW
ncbi:MAG: hypothetical protein K8L91_32145 [Anaerolineae bacterium]|nr:hypothetical protein [Anaerolineae bacterium]